jgi:hypothetical protein
MAISKIVIFAGRTIGPRRGTKFWPRPPKGAGPEGIAVVAVRCAPGSGDQGLTDSNAALASMKAEMVGA